MIKKFTIFNLIFGLAGFGVLLLPVGSSALTESANYIIWADVFSSGGSEDSSSALYNLQDTIGEALILSATSTSSLYGIKAGFRELYADQFITFSVGATDVNLGTLDSAATKTGSHAMTVDTNAVNGFTVTVSGVTLTSGGNTITAIGAVAAASAIGSEQFGINLAANTTPLVGADPAGTAPIGSAASNYNTADSFAYNSGDTVASASVDINETTYTVSYIANISGSTESGTYATTLTYSATANF